MRTSLSCASLLVLAIVSGCSPKSAAPPPAAASAGKKVAAATAGSISGKVSFTGTPPAVEMIKMSSDPACTPNASPMQPSDAVLVGKAGEVQNAFVYVKDGLDPAYTFDVPTKALEFYQRGCTYVPRIFGVRAGQPIEIISDDNTLHNVHALPKSNLEFNKSEAFKGARMTQVFTVPEVMVRFKCDVHAWMNAYVGVMAHPFFAVSAADGTFDLKGLPPGTYTVEAWHERFGTLTQKITVADKQALTVAFAFAAK
jgi:plastocyanin